MGIREHSGDIDNEFFFHCSICSGLDCRCLWHLWKYRLSSLEAVLNQKCPPAPARLSQQLEHEKCIMGITLQHRMGSRCTFLEWRQVHVRDDQCFIGLKNKSSS